MGYPLYILSLLLVIAGAVIFVQHRRILKLKEQFELKEKLAKATLPEPAYIPGQDDFRIKLISILAHDFRGAFMNIISLMDFYKKGQVPPERFDVLFSELKSTSQDNLRSFENTLKWVKTRLKGYSYKAVAINASEALQESIKNNISEIKRKKISLAIKGDEEDWIIYADPQLLGFVLNNLLNNAIKYSYPGTAVECIIERGGDKQDKMVKMQIVDYGIGMDEETKEAVFCHEKTIYTGTAGEKGAGIALLICKDFVEIQHGRLDIASESGNGSAFTLSIPGETGKAAEVFSSSEPGSYCS